MPDAAGPDAAGADAAGADAAGPEPAGSLALRLDPAILERQPGFPRLLRALFAGEGKTRLVGGAVRDFLLGMTVADIDLATQLTPQQVAERLQRAGIKAVPTGIAHGTITAVTTGAAYEITTLRRDVQNFGRHAAVAFTSSWQEDASRRDFTINALYADPLSGEIFDYFDGLADLGAHHVRFIGEALQRIAEDHLRILRFFRFSARFAARLDDEGRTACKARANDLMALSRERIRDELLKLLALPAPAATLAAMLDDGILAPVLPEIDGAGLVRLQHLLAAEEKAKVAGDGLRRLAALLPENPELGPEIAARLKLSNRERRRLACAMGGESAEGGPVAADPRTLAYRIGGAATLDRMLLRGDERAASWAAALSSYQPPRLPISGKDLIAMGLQPGPIVSRKLREVEDRWIEQGFPAAREKVLALARQILGRR